MTGTLAWKGITFGLFMGWVLLGLGTSESQAQASPEPQVQSTPEAQPQVAPEPPVEKTKVYLNVQLGVSKVEVTPSTGPRKSEINFLMGELEWVHKDRIGVVPFFRSSHENGADVGIALRLYPGGGFYFGGGVTSNTFLTYRDQINCWNIFGSCRKVYYEAKGPGQIVSLGKVFESGFLIQINLQNMRQEMIEYKNDSSRAITLQEMVPYTRGDVSVGYRF
ncbi:MAG: hypothetical protein OEV94_02730 [Deltaproteobacteria bacterium]|nr:hypothetical protein [Deltaproteobacteria bacterium]